MRKEGSDAVAADDLLGARVYESYIESPAILQRKVRAVGAGPLEAYAASKDGKRLGDVRPGDLVQCCSFFLVHHLCGFSDSKLRVGRHLHPSAREASERHLETGRERRPYVRATEKTASALRWLDEVKKTHMIMPNAEKVIMPHATHALAHADMVHDFERAAKCDWAEDALMDFYQEQMVKEVEKENRDALEGQRRRGGKLPEAPGPVECGPSCAGAGAGNNEAGDGFRCGWQCVADHLEEEVEVDAAINVSEVQVEGQAPRNVYRYGNPLLGLRKGGYDEHADIPSLQWFLKVWKREREELKIRKWLPFAKCDSCTELRAKVMGTRDKGNKKKLLGQIGEHLRFVKRERLAYAVRRRMGIEQPREYLSMIIDGADQSDHDLPHHPTKSHATDAAWKLKLHLMGVLVHGRGSYAYTCPAHLAQGHNVTIQALVDTLVHLKKADHTLPPCLLLQLDNTTKQCKGKFLMAFLGLLVHEGVFKKVIVSFLPVGHTHEDIDQFFSRVSKQLRLFPAYDRHELAGRIKNGYHKYGSAPVVRHWDNVANISGWLLLHKVCTMADITAHHQFRLFRTASEGTVQMQGRRWPGGGRDDHWSGLNSNKMFQSLFKDDDFPSLLDTWDTVPPAARPEQPPTEDTLRKTREGLNQLYEYLPGMTQQAKDDCDALYELYATPVQEDIAFSWDRADVELLFTPADNVARQPVAPVAVAMDGSAPKVGFYYLVRPAVINEDGSHPFHLVLVKSVDTENAGVRVAHLELSDTDQAKDRPDWCGGTYVPSTGSEPGKAITQLPTLSFNQLQCRVDVRRQGGAWKCKFASGRYGKSLALWWAMRFQGLSSVLSVPVCLPCFFVCLSLFPLSRMGFPN